jgi:MSHA pilin protein MshD
MKKKNKGFTLIEIIIGMVMLSISLAIVTSLIAPTEEQSADNLLQIKAAELGQSLLNDIVSRAFDHNSDMTGGRVRCGEAGAIACTVSSKLGPEDGLGVGLEERPDSGETSRDKYNDVDDFNGYSKTEDALGDGLHSSYGSFKVEVVVQYAGADLNLAHELAKRITVMVTTPLGTELKFATHKANF